MSSPRRLAPPVRDPLPPPAAKANPGYDRTAPVYLGDYVTADSGTGVVRRRPTASRTSCRARRTAWDTDFISPVMGDGKYADSLPLVRRPVDLGREPQDRRGLKLAGTLMHVESTSTATCCWRRTRRPSSTAPPASGSRAWTPPQDGGPTLRESALAGIDATAFIRPGPRPPRRDRQPPRLDAARQRQWGTPSLLRAQRKPASCTRAVELLEQVALRRTKRIEAWQTLDPRELLGDEADQYEKNRDTLDVWFDSGSTRTPPCWAARTAPSPARTAPSWPGPPTSTWKVPTSTAAGSIPRC